MQGEATRPLEATDGSTVDIQKQSGGKAIAVADLASQSILERINTNLERLIIVLQEMHGREIFPINLKED
jgi:hypothetical protein